MRKINYILLICFVILCGGSYAQSDAIQPLNDAILSSETIKLEIKSAKKAVNSLTKQLIITGNPNAEAFSNSMYANMSAVLNESDNINYFIELSRVASGNAFSTTPITDLTNSLVEQQDLALSLTQQISDFILANNNQAAVNLLAPLNAALLAQNTLANKIIKKITAIKTAITPYRVCIRTVDSQGNPVAASDLHGFYAFNVTTGTYIYPEREEDNCFTLPQGTYTFDSFDGYFSGTGSSTVTLSPSLVNAQGIVVVDLVYWSE